MSSQFHTVIALGAAAPSPTNPRKNFPADEQADLADSIRRHGILQPILVRDWPAELKKPDEGVLYEIVAGERRFRAARAAGLEKIPAIVRTLTDLEVLELQLVENLQRQDLHPLEEAAGYELMMQKHGYTADQLAEKIGKSRSYIFGRLKLCALSSQGKCLFYAGALNPSTALLVARIPTEKLQAKAIEDITRKDYNGDTMSVREAQRWIRDRYMLRLADAPFPRGDDKLIPKAGRCFDCPKRTGSQPEIFDDVDSADVCTDPDCFTAKKQAHAENVRKEAEAAGRKVITGKEAEKVNFHAEVDNPKGFKKLDDICYEDPKKRTYGQILGDQVEPVLVEDRYEKDKLIAAVPNTVLAEKLKEAGLGSRIEKQESKKANQAKRHAEETAWRERVVTIARSDLQDALAISPRLDLEKAATLDLIRFLARKVFDLVGFDLRCKIGTRWGAVGKNARERAEALHLSIATMDGQHAMLLLLDCVTVGHLSVPEWTNDLSCRPLLELAEIFGIEAELVREEVKAELEAKGKKADKKAAKPEQKAKKAEQNPVSAASETTPTPSDAPLGAGSVPRKIPGRSPVVVRFRHPDNPELAWTGRGRQPKWVESFLAIPGNTLTMLDVNFIETNETPTAADTPAADTSASEAPAAEAGIEMNETPTAPACDNTLPLPLGEPT